MTNRQLTNGNTAMEPTLRAPGQLSPQSQEIAVSLVRQLAEGEENRTSLSAQAPFRSVGLLGSIRDQGAYACLKSFLFSIDSYLGDRSAHSTQVGWCQ